MELSDLIPADELVYTARAAQEALADEFPLTKYLPNVNVNSTRWASTDTGGASVETAQARALDTSPMSIGTSGGVRRSGELPPVGAQAFISEADLLVMGQLTDAGKALEVAAAFDSVVKVVRSVEQRAELARGNAMAYGGVGFAENGVNCFADFGANPGTASAQFPTAAVNWTDPTAKILTDLLAWAEAYENVAGEAPGHILVSSPIASAICANQEVVRAATKSTAVDRVPIGDASALFELNGLPPITKISKKVRRGGVAVPVLPADRVVFAPSTPGGQTSWGVTVHGTKLVQAGNLEIQEVGGLVVVARSSIEPPSEVIVGAATIMPVIGRPETVFSALVVD